MSVAPTYGLMPAHIAIIMDGNGRWARARHRPRVFGHAQGVKTVRRVVEGASQIGVKCLTLYSFSTENWTRPKAEIAALFNLLREYVESDLDTLHEKNVRVRILGSRSGLSSDLLQLIQRVEETTQNNTAFNLNIAFNYGGRDELLRAAARAVADGQDLTKTSEAEFAKYLDTAGLPDADLVIRTSGEKRISNFLLWQAAYAEFVFTDVLWPDFGLSDLESAIADFNRRERRFGNLDQSEVA
ncbi:isoprenyl transferase 2 [Litorimonas cladophorae]|uniref:Isoprenyl transferase n=2 Tax=Litorimonas cladophorae TaxID=1220491 RepID=A0A918KCN4_9PROT|nr:isoprenyl transferase 2 [Litorimonas cladophorae]